MFPNVTLVQLRSFQSVAELGSFTLAADRLCLSQSAVSQAVAGLERMLGAQMFARGREGVSLTAAGTAVLSEVRLALAAVERLAICARSTAPLSGSLRVGVVQSAAIQLFPAWVRKLRNAHPAVTISLYEGTDPEVLAWVASGVTEVGIASRTHLGLEALPVFKDNYVVLLPKGHPLAGRRAINLRDLNGHRMVQSGGGCETLIEELLMAADSHPQIICLVRDNSTLVSMVREGIGLTIIPELAIPADQNVLDIVGLQPVLPRTLHLLTKAYESLGPLAAEFLKIATASGNHELLSGHSE